MKSIDQLRDIFIDFLSKYDFPDQPASLYDPVRYILSLGGKRMRPAFLLAANNLFISEVNQGLEAAMAIEVFHNFSLLHDDIMDDSNIRRGQPTTHIKYDENAAILSGDVMMIWSYKLLESYEKAAELNQIFTKTAIEVCEGQAMDIAFESRHDVTISEYIEMITLKTSVLVGAGMSMGAVIGGASDFDINHCYQFGKNLGIAFQIQDDILDTFGNEAAVGKRIGGDLVQKKKTYLYLKSLELLNDKQVVRLKELYSDDPITDEEDHIAEVTDLFNKAFVKVHAEELKLVYQQLAMSHLEAISVPKENKQVLKSYAELLLNRNA